MIKGMEILTGGLNQTSNSKLGHTVGTGAKKALLSRNRGSGDEAPTFSLLNHLLCGVLEAEIGALGIDVLNCCPRFFRY